MAEQRSSIRGGSEILSGEPQAVEITRGGSDPPQVEANSPGAESSAAEPAAAMAGDAGDASPAPSPPEPPDLSEAELGEALYEEARAGELDAHEGEDLWASDMEWPPTPEMELAFFEEGLTAEDVPEPITEEPVPVLEDAMEAMELSEEEAVETGNDADAVLPATPPEEYFIEEEAEPADGMDIQAVGEPVAPIELPERALPEEETISVPVSSGVLFAKLNEEIDKLYQQVLDEVGVNKDITTECQNLLLKARDVVRRGDVAMIAQAEYYVEQARARLRRAADSKTGARRNAWWILLWGFLWGMLFVSALFFVNAEWVQRYIDGLGLSNTPVNPSVFLSAMLWGGLGGVVAVWYNLFKHVALRDFDSTYNISYVGKPFFGLVLGASVYMIIQLGIVSLGIWPTGSVEGTSAYGIAPWIIYLMAWVSGFKENRIFGVVDFAMKRVFSGGESAPPASTTGLLG